MTKTTQSITIREVARQAGVSVATVSRYLNQNAPVSPEVAARLEQAMTDLHYVPHAVARSLATHKTHTIGLLLSDMHGDFFAPLLSGVEEASKQGGYDMLIASTQHSSVRGDRPLPLGPHNCDGVLVFAESLEDEPLRNLALQEYPVVLIHQSSPPDLHIPCITVENKAASYKLVDHLITAHHRQKIVFLSGPAAQEDSHWREMGYLQALAAHGLPFDPQRLASGDFDRYVAEASICRLLDAGVEFDAVFAGDDEAAVGVLAALHAAGRRIPEEISVVGFDDQRLAPYLNPPLTTVRAPTEEVGRTAARQLLHLIQKQPVEEIVLLPTEIIFRRSCGCA